MKNKTVIIGIIILFVSVGFQPAFANEAYFNKETKEGEQTIIEDNVLGDWELGFILCRVCYIETWSWFITGMPGQRIECIDLETGDIVYQEKTRIFGYILFIFLPLGHDYKIITYTEYGQMSEIINDLDFFQKIELLFIIGH